jgi:hypothetical protein
VPNLDPKVAQLSPNLYSAAYNAGLQPNQINTVNQIAGTVNLNKKLMNMNNDAAQKEYKLLDPGVQDQLSAMYGEAPYVPKAGENLIWRGIKDIKNIAIGPFKAAFKVAGEYNRGINTPYLVARQIQQGSSPFDAHVWSGAWDGKAIYDNKSLASLHGEYGNTDTFVAMKTLEGLKPGEIIDAYGTPNAEIIGSITKMLSEPEQFKGMLNKFKGAQVSYGRDISRILLNAQPNDNKLYSSNEWNKLSGTIDFLAQIFTDPLTYITGGTSKAITRADKLAEALAAGEKSIAEVFARKDIRNTWDNVAGPMVERLHNARILGGEEGKKAAIIVRDEIKRLMPDLNNNDMLKLLTTNKVFNADKAEEFFGKSEPMIELLSGRVDGTTFFRTGIPIAKRSREFTSNLNKKMGDYFNGGIENAANLSDDFVKDIRSIGLNKDPLVLGQTPLLEKLTGELASVKRKLGRYAARFPGAGEIGILDNNVDRTLSTVVSLARVIYPKAHAEYFGEAFRTSDPQDRTILLRGLYTQIFHSMGLPGKPGGKALMEKILQDKFADTTSFLSKAEVNVPPQFANAIKSKGILEEQPLSGVGGLLKTSYDGPVHFYNAKPAVGNLPWNELSEYATSFGERSAIGEIVDAIGGATRHTYARKTTNAWTILTLFPRLGIRSAIDEAFFYSMMAPGEDIFKLGLGRKLHKGIQAYTGDEKSIPPIKRAILNALGKNPARYLDEKDRLTSVMVNGEERFRLDTEMNVAAKVVPYLEHILPETNKAANMDYMYQAMAHHPEIANSIVNSSIGKSAINNGISGGDLAGQIVSMSHLSNMHKELGFIPTGTYGARAIADLEKIGPSAVSAAHYQNWFLRFTKNSRNLGKGFETYINPGEIFVRNNGLRTEKEFSAARDEILGKIGVNPDTLEVTDVKLLNGFLELSQQTVRDAERGWSGADTAVKRVETMLLDMYEVFHGNAVAFNDRLLNHIKETASIIQDEARVGGNQTMAYGKAVRLSLDSVDYPVFDELTKGFRPEGVINTDLNFSKADTNEAYLQKIRQWADDNISHPMDWMDAQNNHLFRQPALWATYIKFREKYARLETQYAKELTENNTHITPEFARELAEKKFTEVAMSHAGSNVLKAVDNPAIRSNLAWSLRTTGRFYRATEDFYRRLYRLKEVSPQVLYRLRLAHLGLQSNGFIHPDQNGDPYLVMPGDNLIYHAINGTFSVLTGNPDAIKQPMFNDFTVKISMGNPSFQQDAGQPSLSGPFIAIPILGIQKALNLWGGDIGKKVSIELDNAILGNVNENLNLTKALVPSSLQRVYSMLPKGEKDQQLVSATQQAIAYNAAHGLFLSPEKLGALPKEESAKATSDYLKTLKVSVNNILFMRGFLGLLSPIAPGMQESKDVPDYLKNAGINGLRPEFADILQSIMRNAKGRVVDPYELALMAFTGKHPGKLVYTVARDNKQTNVVVNKTKEMRQWMLNNGDAIETYKDAALIFAPHIGDYNSNIYLWMQASGMMEQRGIQDYYEEVAIAQDRQKYYDYRSQAEQQLQLPLNGSQRQQVLDELAFAQDSLKKANPMLEIALNSKSFGIGKQEDMLAKLQGAIADKNFKMTDATRAKMSTATTLVDNALNHIRNDANMMDVMNSAEIKQQIKQQTIDALKELGGSVGKGGPSDPFIAEATRAIFLPLLNFYARTTLK